MRKYEINKGLLEELEAGVAVLYMTKEEIYSEMPVYLKELIETLRPGQWEYFLNRIKKFSTRKQKYIYFRPGKIHIYSTKNFLIKNLKVIRLSTILLECKDEPKQFKSPDTITTDMEWKDEKYEDDVWKGVVKTFKPIDPHVLNGTFPPKDYLIRDEAEGLDISKYRIGIDMANKTNKLAPIIYGTAGEHTFVELDSKTIEELKNYEFMRPQGKSSSIIFRNWDKPFDIVDAIRMGKFDSVINKNVNLNPGAFRYDEIEKQPMYQMIPPDPRVTINENNYNMAMLSNQGPANNSSQAVKIVPQILNNTALICVPPNSEKDRQKLLEIMYHLCPTDVLPTMDVYNTTQYYSVYSSLGNYKWVSIVSSETGTRAIHYISDVYEAYANEYSQEILSNLVLGKARLMTRGIKDTDQRNKVIEIVKYLCPKGDLMLDSSVLSEDGSRDYTFRLESIDNKKPVLNWTRELPDRKNKDIKIDYTAELVYLAMLHEKSKEMELKDPQQNVLDFYNEFATGKALLLNVAESRQSRLDTLEVIKYACPNDRTTAQLHEDTNQVDRYYRITYINGNVTWANTGNPEDYTKQGFKTYSSSILVEAVKILKHQAKQKEIAMSKKDDRFPFELRREQMLTIIDCACNGWKTKLGKEWGDNLIYNTGYRVSQDFYESMRAACTKEQHEIFDTIFGEDDTFEWIPGDAYLLKESNGAKLIRFATNIKYRFIDSGNIPLDIYLNLTESNLRSDKTSEWDKKKIIKHIGKIDTTV